MILPRLALEGLHLHTGGRLSNGVRLVGAKWYSRRRSDAETPLSRDRIVAAALALLDEAGLDGLSMRRLAERLGVKAASLYWYVRDKQELLELLADAICAEIQAPDAQARWRAQLEAFEREYRRVLLTHRDAVRVFSGTIPAGPNRLRLVDLALAVLFTAGFGGLDAVRAGRLMADFVEGFVREEVDEPRLVADLAASGTDMEAALADLGRPFVEAPAERYPNIAALAEYLPDADSDGRFRFGLAILLDGLEQQVSTPGPGAPTAQHDE